MRRPVLFPLIGLSFLWTQALVAHAVDTDNSYQPIPEGKLRFIDGGSPATLELALDQVWVRPAGKRAFVETIQPLASNAKLYHFVSAREAAAPGDECGMVAYLAGRPRNDSTIRFVTRKLTVRLNEDARTVESADAIAQELGMEHARSEISINGWTVFMIPNSADSIPVADLVNAHPQVLTAHAMIGFRAATKSCEETSPTFVPDDPGHLDPDIGNAFRFAAMNIPNVWENVDPFFGAPFLFRPYAGLGRIVAVSDDGLDWDHEDLINNVSEIDQEDFTDGRGADRDPDNDGLHGTNVAGIIFAEGANGIGIAGVAPKAEGAGIRWDVGITDDARVVEVIDHKTFKFDVHNASWGMP
ncbi:MAG: S8 family serine peptidase, partial [Verrucomicrobiales bacterium]|nr:S8 family serine peptidase [Verrucomicrobiales bacterium]